jgi:predicted enzyme related to lactoylglutathione lyase
MPNPIIHVELQTQDPDRARVFYARLFDWSVQDVPGMDYAMIVVGEGTGGGIMKTRQPGTPSQWIPFMAVDDVETATQKARALGATIVKGPAEAPGYGWYSVVVDPTGATFGMWKPSRLA